MAQHTRNKISVSWTIKPDNKDFVARIGAHRELSESRMVDEMIEFYRERYDPTFRSHRRVGSAPYQR